MFGPVPVMDIMGRVIYRFQSMKDHGLVENRWTLMILSLYLSRFLYNNKTKHRLFFYLGVFSSSSNCNSKEDTAVLNFELELNEMQKISEAWMLCRNRSFHLLPSSDNSLILHCSSVCSQFNLQVFAEQQFCTFWAVREGIPMLLPSHTASLLLQSLFHQLVTSDQLTYSHQVINQQWFNVL